MKTIIIFTLLILTACDRDSSPNEVLTATFAGSGSDINTVACLDMPASTIGDKDYSWQTCKRNNGIIYICIYKNKQYYKDYNAECQPLTVFRDPWTNAVLFPVSAEVK
jgi:hypothetical protein